MSPPCERCTLAYIIRLSITLIMNFIGFYFSVIFYISVFTVHIEKMKVILLYAIKISFRKVLFRCRSDFEA